MTRTTISIRSETKDLLGKLRLEGQTYDEVVREPLGKGPVKDVHARWNRILRDEEFIPLNRGFE